MKRKSLIILLFNYTLGTIYSQDIAVDNKQNPVFSFYSFEDVRFNIDADKPLSISFSAFRFLTSVNQAAPATNNFITNRTPGPIPTRISGLVVNAAVINSEDQFLKFNSLRDFQPGGKLQIGWQSTMYTYTTNPTITSNHEMIGGINLTTQVDNLKICNPDDEKISYKYPFSFGIDGNFGQMVVSTGVFQVFYSLHGSYRNTWNDEELKNYQKIESVETKTTVVALEDFDGRFGQLKIGRNTGRISASLPMFYSILNVTPYCSAYFYDYTSPEINVGAFFNILGDWFNVEKSSIPSTIGLGWDFNIKSGTVSAPNYFIKGTLSFGKL